MTDPACVVLSAPERVELEPLAMLAPEPGWVQVRTQRAGICGSDVHTYRRGHPFRPYPLRPGHEAAGVVSETGRGVRGLAPGDEVYLMPELPCSRCVYCRGGRPNLCSSPGGIGGSVPGAMASFFLAPETCVRRRAGGISAHAASLLEPLAAAVHGVVRAGRVDGVPAVVLGAGTIGLLTLLVLVDAGAENVVVADPVPAKRQAALTLGAAAAVDPASADAADALRDAAGTPPRAVFDCVGAAASLTLAVDLAMRGGTVVVVGAPAGDLSLPVEAMHHGEVTLTGSILYDDRDFAEAERLVLEDPLSSG